MKTGITPHFDSEIEETLHSNSFSIHISITKKKWHTQWQISFKYVQSLLWFTFHQESLLTNVSYSVKLTMPLKINLSMCLLIQD